jgi:NADH dehydrogenase FAD-containing subunit
MGSSTTVETYDFEGPEETLNFDYCIYALGSGMPDPCNVWSEHPNLPPGIDNDEHLRGKGSKKCGVTWMEEKAKDRRDAKRILIVGGGALGIRQSTLSIPSAELISEFATDLKEIYPDKEVTLLHSRPQLMPIYPIEVHVAGELRVFDLGAQANRQQ